MPHRPPPQPYTSSTSSSVVHRYTHPHALYRLFANLTFHVVAAKLEDELARVYECIDELGGRCVPAEEAWLVITRLKGRQRLSRSLDTRWIDTKPILKVEYIFDAYEACLTAANSPAPTSLPRLPPRDDYLLHFTAPAFVLPKTPLFLSDDEDEPSSKRRRLTPRKGGVRAGGDHSGGDGGELEDMAVYDEDIAFEDIPSNCVLRPCPLTCINQDIIDAIKPIFEEREFEEGQQKNSNVLSYRKSLSVTVPRRIKSGKDALKLQGIGEKVANRIDEYLTTGSISESLQILSSPRFLALRTFASVYTIGHHRAKELYDRHHCRTLEDVRLHFEAMEEDGAEVRERDKVRRRMRGKMKGVEIVEEWMRLKSELDEKIPREEVEEIAACVMEHLSVFIPGCEHTICGGYRRGKSQSNDVDVVFRPPKDGQDIGLLKALYLRMAELGIITHVLHVTHRDAITPIHAAPQNFDNLDKAFVIFKLPGPGRRLHRRVDLISAPRDRYASAVLSWSGSMMFERDMKRYAENERGYKFRAGLIKIATGEEVNPETERDFFRFLGLRYVPPELRNADG
ncbi:hypothetical protein IAT38_003864 [Cryptococcus sp. DSM 104549]